MVLLFRFNTGSLGCVMCLLLSNKGFSFCWNIIYVVQFRFGEVSGSLVLFAPV